MLAPGLGSSLLHGSFIPEGLTAFRDTLSSRPKLERKRPSQTTEAHVKTLLPCGVYCLLVESIGQRSPELVAEPAPPAVTYW